MDGQSARPLSAPVLDARIRVEPADGLTDADDAHENRPASPTQFYAHFQLDSVRGIKQLGDILDHIAAHLGPNLELALEVRAENADGYNDATCRTVSENAQNLNAQAAEFE